MLMQISAIGTLGDEVLQNVKNLGERPKAIMKKCKTRKWNSLNIGKRRRPK